MKKHLFYVVFSSITAVFVVAGVAFADAIPIQPVPTLGEWGMFGTALVLGLAATYRILKQKK